VRKVFISSTSEDLEPHRIASRDAIILAGCHPVMMEYFTPQGKRKPYAACMAEVDECDLLVAIVAHRYGWVPEDQPGGGTKSITWLECERAKEVIACVVDENHTWPKELKESYRLSEAAEQGTFTPDLAAEVTRNIAQLKKFRAWLSGRGFWWEFTSPEQLANGILAALAKGGGPGDPSKYLAWLREQTAWIDIRGLQVGAAKAYRFPIQDLYISLTTAGRNKPLEKTLESKRVVIVGDPGSGKTTFLRRLAFEACGATGSLAVAAPGFPILIRIGELEDHVANCHGRKEAGVPATAESADWLGHFLAAQRWDLDFDYFDRKMHEEQTLVLLDGLDEAPDNRRRERMARLFENATQRYRECGFVVTTRPGAYQGLATLAGFDQVKIDDLDDEAVRTFLRHWSTALYPGDAASSEKHYQALLEAVTARLAIRRMARNPVMLTALAVVHWNDRRLPEQRSELYESILGWLAKAREKEGRQRAERCLTLLGHLALGLQNEAKGRVKQIGKRLAAELIAPQFRDVPEPERIAAAEHFLEQEEVDSGIIVSRGAMIEYWHLTLQEHLAARSLAGLPDADQHKLLFDRGNLNKPEWRESVLLFAGLLASKQGPEKLDALFAAMLDRQGATLADQARCAGLMGAMLSDVKPSGYKLEDQRYGQLLEKVMVIFDPQRSEDVPLQTRVEAAEALGQAGDPRLRENNWVGVPAGSFVMGEGEDAHEVELSAYEIGKYPVTVEEYEKYVDDGAPEPEQWDKQILYPNRPVVGVSWDQAVAYCKWAGVRLPTEGEWERAARGTEGRRYPWSDPDPDPTRANYEDTEIGAPTPVGLFPLGMAPNGIHDLAGNVWEWVADWYAARYGDIEFNPTGPTDGRYRVLRGGSWYAVLGSLRGAYRYRGAPSARNVDIGFRCARDV
jgi:formylglycine-generating enzyme required for sulfatase activity